VNLIRPVLFLIITSFSIQAQSQDLGPWNGTLVFEDGSEWSGTFSYNPFLSEEAFLVRNDSTLIEHKISHVKSFSYFDSNSRTRRYFKKFTFDQRGGNEYDSRFFEELHQTNQISILKAKEIILKVTKDRFGQPTGKTKIKERHPVYLLDHRDNILYPFSTAELKRMTQDKKDEILYFIKKRKIDLWQKNVDDYISVINYYASLDETNH